MPDTPVSCAVCGRPPSDPYKSGALNGWSMFCYADADDHSIMVTGHTREICIDRWNALNTCVLARRHMPAPRSALARILGFLWRR